jgi:hypothetical protein
VTCYATEDTARIVNRLYCNLQPLTILTRSWLQLLITLLHWLTSELSIVSNYHTFYVFTLWNSRQDLTQRIHLLRLLLNNSLVELLLTNWLLRHSSSSYKPSVVRAALLPVARSVSQQRDCVTSLAETRRSRDTPLLLVRVTSWRLRGEDPASPTAAQRVFGREAFSGRLPSSALLRNPTMGWHVTLLPLYGYSSRIA